MAKTRRRRRRTARRQPAPPWVWALAGLIVGLLVAGLVFLQIQSPQSGQQDKTVALQVPAPEDKHARPRKKAAPPSPPPKLRFDFYNLLPEMEVIVPDEDIRGTPMPEGVKQVEKPGTYLLQAGSFRNHHQAEQLRARLTLLGLETSIQTVSVDHHKAWHRVRVGPFKNLRELNEARALLKKNGVDAILIRLKG